MMEPTVLKFNPRFVPGCHLYTPKAAQSNGQLTVLLPHEDICSLCGGAFWCHLLSGTQATVPPWQFCIWEAKKYFPFPYYTLYFLRSHNPIRVVDKFWWHPWNFSDDPGHHSGDSPSPYLVEALGFSVGYFFLFVFIWDQGWCKYLAGQH